MSDQDIMQSIKLSTQARARTKGDNSDSLAHSLLLYLARANDLIPMWWSKSRDYELRRFWKRSDHLAGAIYTMITKMTTIPFKIVPRDMSVKAHVRLAEEYTDNVINASEFGEGWTTLFSKMLEDFVGQDNGMFVEVIGGGPKDGPIEGPAIALAHLDAYRCTRTGSPIYPVVYSDRDGNLYKLHYTRVMYQSQMPSAIQEMNGVGMCAVSRAVNVAQNLIDISIYKQEKLGSRPPRQLVITQGGLDPDDLALAINEANLVMNNEGLSRFAKTIAVGARNIPDADAKIIELSTAWDGFNEKESTVLGMAVISMAIGMDARELFPGMESGASKADAVIQHLKQRGKGPGHIIQVVERLVDQKFLPPFLHAVFDYQDDSEDRQVAEIQSVRAQSRERNLGNMTTTPRVERQIMLSNGEISQAQFDELELGDGRLPDGVDVRYLYHSSDSFFKEYLGEGKDREDSKIKLMALVSTTGDTTKLTKGRQALAAISAIERDEEEEEQEQMMLEQEMVSPTAPEQNRPKRQNIDDSYQQERVGRKLPRDITRPVNEPENYSRKRPK